MHDNNNNKQNTTLELFSGTQSFTKVARALLDKTHSHFITVDNDPAFSDSTTFHDSVLTWDYKNQLTPFDHTITHIWASCPCTEYSMAKRNGPPRRLDYADSLVEKTLEIIDYYTKHSNPALTFYIENPSHSLLKT